jgi:hypothetical protein
MSFRARLTQFNAIYRFKDSQIIQPSENNQLVTSPFILLSAGASSVIIMNDVDDFDDFLAKVDKVGKKITLVKIAK